MVHLADVLQPFADYFLSELQACSIPLCVISGCAMIVTIWAGKLLPNFRGMWAQILCSSIGATIATYALEPAVQTIISLCS